MLPIRGWKEAVEAGCRMRAWILISSAPTRHMIPLNHYNVQNCIIKSTGKHKVRGTKLKKSSVTLKKVGIQ